MLECLLDEILQRKLCLYLMEFYERQTQFIDSAIVQYVGIDLAINFRGQKVRHTNQPMELVACRKVMTLTVPDTKSTTTDDCK